MHRLSRTTVWRLSILSVIILVAIPSLPIGPAARGSGGTLLVSPSSRPLAPPGTRVSYTVSVSNMDPFNAWDIMVNATNSAINATSLSINGNVLAKYGQITETVNCVNGGGNSIPVNQPGNLGCTGDDGPGIVHSSVVLYSYFTPAGTNGLLFNITYKTGSGTGSPVIIFKDIIANATPNPVVYNVQNGVYGNPYPGFFMEVRPIGFRVFAGGWHIADVRLSSYGGFNGNVNLTASGLPSPDTTTSFTPKALALTSGIRLTSVMNVTATLTARTATYTNVKINATGGGSSHAFLITIEITAPTAIGSIQEFSVSAMSAMVGDKLTVSSTISNIGTIPGSLTLVVTWQGFIVKNHTITLSPQEVKAYVDTWDTSGYPPANATLTAQILNSDHKTLNFILNSPPVPPFYLDPLFLGILSVAIAAPSFLYLRHNSEQKRKKK